MKYVFRVLYTKLAYCGYWRHNGNVQWDTDISHDFAQTSEKKKKHIETSLGKDETIEEHPAVSDNDHDLDLLEPISEECFETGFRMWKLVGKQCKTI